jgi:Tetracyclin repressor-like, C-terminal domain
VALGRGRDGGDDGLGLGRIATVLDAPQSELRAALADPQIVGMVMARYIVGVEPSASANPKTLVTAIGPTLERCLTGDLALA